MIHRIFAALLFPGLLLAAPPTPTIPPPVRQSNTTDSAAAILARYAAAWRGAGEMKLSTPLTFGVRVQGESGGEFTLVVGPEPGGTLRRGLPSELVPILETDIDTLRTIDRGELSAMTAMARAKMSDRTPLDVRFPEGFRWTAEAQSTYLPLTFHLFSRDVPEVVRFGEGASRFVHGGNSAILYYDRGLRTSWYQLKPGMHINADRSQQTNPFASLFIITRGEIIATIGGTERIAKEGEALFVPSRTTHEFRVDDGGYAEFILIMFGDGA